MQYSFKELQQKSNLTNTQMAEYLGVGLRTIERWRKDGCNKLSVIRDLKNLTKTK